MRIGALAAVSGVTTRGIRFYERAGLLPAPPRTAAGYRDYPPGAPSRLAFIRAAQAAGLSLAEIREILAIRDHGQPPCTHVTALLRSHLNQTDQRLAELTATRAMLGGLLTIASAADPSNCTGSICRILDPDSGRADDQAAKSGLLGPGADRARCQAPRAGPGCSSRARSVTGGAGVGAASGLGGQMRGQGRQDAGLVLGLGGQQAGGALGLEVQGAPQLAGGVSAYRHRLCAGQHAFADGPHLPPKARQALGLAPGYPVLRSPDLLSPTSAGGTAPAAAPSAGSGAMAHQEAESPAVDLASLPGLEPVRKQLSDVIAVIEAERSRGNAGSPITDKLSGPTRRPARARSSSP